jgi:hypothetical protein
MINASTGRVIIFTPERIEQIKNLVERGATFRGGSIQIP